MVTGHVARNAAARGRAEPAGPESEPVPAAGVPAAESLSATGISAAGPAGAAHGAGLRVPAGPARRAAGVPAAQSLPAADGAAVRRPGSARRAEARRRQEEDDDRGDRRGDRGRDRGGRHRFPRPRQGRRRQDRRRRQEVRVTERQAQRDGHRLRAARPDNQRGSDSDPKPVVPGWKVVTNPKWGTQFDVPGDWEVASSGMFSGFEDAKKPDGPPVAGFSAPAYYKSKWCVDDSDGDGSEEDTGLMRRRDEGRPGRQEHRRGRDQRGRQLGMGRLRPAGPQDQGQDRQAQAVHHRVGSLRQRRPGHRPGAGQQGEVRQRRKVDRLLVQELQGRLLDLGALRRRRMSRTSFRTPPSRRS